MHEISIAGAIVDAFLDAARKHDAKQVKEVYLEIGELTALNPDQLKFIFETITRGTPAEEARYTIEVIRPLITCKNCTYHGAIEYVEKLHFFLPVIRCPRCEGTDVDILTGRECCVKKITIA